MLVQCPHCKGEGLCNDDYHQDTFAGAAKELFGSDDGECPSCHDGGPYNRGTCPHCDGRSIIDDSLL